VRCGAVQWGLRVFCVVTRASGLPLWLGRLSGLCMRFPGEQAATRQRSDGPV
jgi:hypothetical protein